MPRKILLADDSVTAQNMGRRILSEAGYEVVTVNNGSTALKKLAEEPPDLAILDIYMPGYGGLEVCQRIKENPETSGIPVLLTVGKLEPFKPDEARRVRADAHLIKPFEATELLAALTRLENGMVPQEEGSASGKAAKSKADAPASQGKEKEKKFGNPDNGWKQRLKIVPSDAKRKAARERGTPSTAFREFPRPEAQEVEPAITADEIAAIAAAAAAVENSTPVAELEAPEEVKSGTTEAEPAGPTSYQQIVAASYAAAAEEQATEEQAPEAIAETVAEAIAEPVDAMHPAEAAFSGEAVEAANEVTNEIPHEAGGGVSTAIPEDAVACGAQEESAVANEATDDEVAAALAALVPAFGNEPVTAGVSEGALAGVAPGWRTFADGRGRWMAEKVALLESEASLILEEEMEKAYAAMAEYAQGSASSAVELETVSGSAAMDGGAAMPEIPAGAIYVAQVEETVSTIDSVSAASSSYEPEPVAAAADRVEPVTAEANAEEMPAAGAREHAWEVPAPEAVAESNAAVVLDSNGAERAVPELETVNAAGASDAEAFQERSAYAAAAGTEFHSIGQVAASPVEAAPSGAPQEKPEMEATAAPAEVDRAHETELAAAWAHWRQIRETVANPQLTSQLANAAAAGYKEIHSTQPADESAGEELSATDPAAIASIVDSVLAELKPKLVAEIARKLAKDRK